MGKNDDMRSRFNRISAAIYEQGGRCAWVQNIPGTRSTLYCYVTNAGVVIVQHWPGKEGGGDAIEVYRACPTNNMDDAIAWAVGPDGSPEAKQAEGRE
jgi:hypothetical protein